MNQFEKKEIIQAILIADNNVENFRPLSDLQSTALLPLVNVPMLDYALEALNRSAIEEVFVYTSFYLQSVRDYIKLGIESLSSWSVNMTVHVIGGEGCRCFGDAMRDLDAKGLIRGNFILLGADTITNADLRPLFEEHKKTVKYDKGAAATLIFKEAATRLSTGNELMIAMDVLNRRLHHHQRLRLNNKETHFEIPLEVFFNNSQITLLHNLIDPQIAIGSPTMLSLFSDNFDFETRDDFVRGLLINEEILDSRIYVSLLRKEEYAHKVNNWLAYQIVSEDVINRWAYPLVPDMGVISLQQQYVFLKNNIYKSPKANLTKVTLRENVVIQDGTSIDFGTIAKSTVIGRNCRIGQNCKTISTYIMDNVVIGNNCELNCCIIGKGAIIGNNCVLKDGTVIGDGCIVLPNTKISMSLVKANVDNDGEEVLEKLGEHAYVIDDTQYGKHAGHESDSEDEELELDIVRIPKMCKLPLLMEESDYSSSSDEDESRAASPLPDDANIFLSEVMDSLQRGYEEKSNPDFLILEINSSRYAYNMSLKEVNFNVAKAIFSMDCINEPTGNVLVEIKNVLKQLGPVMSNYIKTQDAMIDCLKALEDICDENQHINDKISQVVHYLYDKDFVSEDAIVEWFEQLDADDHTFKQNLKKLIEWLSQSSEEEEDDDDDEQSS